MISDNTESVEGTTVEESISIEEETTEEAPEKDVAWDTSIDDEKGLTEGDEAAVDVEVLEESISDEAIWDESEKETS